MCGVFIPQAVRAGRVGGVLTLARSEPVVDRSLIVSKGDLIETDCETPSIDIRPVCDVGVDLGQSELSGTSLVLGGVWLSLSHRDMDTDALFTNRDFHCSI